jgi:negative regulator of sigma E activity
MEIDFNLIRNELDQSTDLLTSVDIISEIGFTEKQAKFINLVVVQALEKYDKQLKSIETASK